MSEQPPCLWRPSAERLARSHVNHYLQWLAARDQHFADYQALWQWSVDHIEEFWASIWDYFDIQCSVPYQQVVSSHPMPGATWFEGARLNFAQQLFRFNTNAATAHKDAIVAESETRDLIAHFTP